MSSIPSGKSGVGGRRPTYSERFAVVLREAGENRIPFGGIWVTRFGKFIAPRRYHEMGAAEVEAFFPKSA